LKSDSHRRAAEKECKTPRAAEITRSDDLGRAIGETDRRYRNFIKARGRRTGDLFRCRFTSVVLDDTHLIRAGWIHL
jgi:hypothetical protein